MCRVLQVSVSGYYAYRRRPESWRTVIDDVLMAHVRIAFGESGKTYGAPRMYPELRAARLATSTTRVARLMRAAGLAARPKARRRVVTTDSTHADPIAPNRLAR
jgi:transposase InsO family protein